MDVDLVPAPYRGSLETSVVMNSINQMSIINHINGAGTLRLLPASCLAVAMTVLKVILVQGETVETQHKSPSKPNHKEAVGAQRKSLLKQGQPATSNQQRPNPTLHTRLVMPPRWG